MTLFARRTVTRVVGLFGIAGCLSSQTGSMASLSDGSAMGSGSLNGAVQGFTPIVADVIAARGVDDPAYPNRVSVIFSSRPSVCKTLQVVLSGPAANVASASLLILVFTPSDPSGALTPGTYSPSNMSLNGIYETYDSTCTSVAPHADVSSGTATISSVGSSVTGTFDLMLGSDHLTGTFDAPQCSVPPRSDAATGDGGFRCLP
jgi:hypothetical protein